MRWGFKDGGLLLGSPVSMILMTYAANKSKLDAFKYNNGCRRVVNGTDLRRLGQAVRRIQVRN